LDKASIIGVVLGAACLGLVAFESSHGNFAMFFSMEGVLMVGVGTVSVLFMAMPLEKLLRVPGYLKAFLLHKGKSPAQVVKLMSELGEKARRDGMLSLESEVDKLDDPFLISGLKMAIDGVDPDNIEATLRMEVMAMQERHAAGKKFFDLIKLYGPGWALAGTLLGQIGMFGNLGGSIEVMGHMLSLAVVATLYGVLIANAVAGPMGDKLAMRSAEEILSREMVVQGLLSIQAGDNPRVTMDRMLAFVPQSHREKLKPAA
jgi:chemotaxis protein MotA